MGINFTGRRRKRLMLGLLAAGVVGVTTLGGAMAASAEMRSSDLHPTEAAARADLERLVAECEAEGRIAKPLGIVADQKKSISAKEAAEGDFSQTNGFIAKLLCEAAPVVVPPPPASEEPDTSHLDFFSPV